MNCSLFRSQFSAYLDGGLPAGIVAEVESHLDSCPACSGLLEAYRSGIDIYRKRVEIEPPADMFERVMAEVGARGQSARVVPLRPARTRHALAAAAVIAIAMIGSLLFTGGDNPEVTFDTTVDSTMDVVNAEELAIPVETEVLKVRKPAQKAYLASYGGDEEPSFSYGVSNHPLIVESGVHSVAD